MKLHKLYAALVLAFSSITPLFGISAHALPSSDIVIAQVVTGTPSATSELVVLHNAGQEDVDVTDWCIQYSSASNGETFSKSTCIRTEAPDTQVLLGAQTFVRFATESFETSFEGYTSDILMSGGFAATGGHVRVVDAASVELDRVGWGTAVAPEGDVAAVENDEDGVLTRDVAAIPVDTDNNNIDFALGPVMLNAAGGLYEQTLVTDVDLCPNYDGVQVEMPEYHAYDGSGNCYPDVCPNLDGLHRSLPTGYTIDIKVDRRLCIPIVPEDSVVVITELYPNAPNADLVHGFIEVYNPGTEPIRLANYMLVIDGLVGLLPNVLLQGGSYQHVTRTSTGFVLPADAEDIRLIAPAGNIVDVVQGYTNAPGDMSWALIQGEWQYASQITRGAANPVYSEPAVDTCSNIDGLQSEVPEGMELHDDGLACVEIVVLEDAVLDITELYPNAPSYDTGQEFIELYNPNTESVDLHGYIVSLQASSADTYVFDGGVIAPGEYVSIGDLESGIVLPNTTGYVELVAPNGDIVSVSQPYDDPQPNSSWALIGGVWQYTNQPTPGGFNVLPLEDEIDEDSDDDAQDDTVDDGSDAPDDQDGSTTPVLPACPAGKYRNPATNRCKNLEDPVSTLKPCAAHQYRSSDTNRCRNLPDAAAVTVNEGAIVPVADRQSAGSLGAQSTNYVPCKEGQYRNPATNRCKKLPADDQQVTAADAAYVPCAADQERNPATNRCRKVAATIAASGLKPCAAHQYRNPETNRCKSITAASTELKPCNPGQERNPATNRCRASVGVATNISAAGSLPEIVDVAVEQVTDGFDWMMPLLAVVGVAGYVGYEWRAEIAQKFAYVNALRRHR